MTEPIRLDYQLVERLSQRETDINQHLKTLYNLVLELRSRVVVELGAGQSTYVLAAAVRETNGILYSIDLLSAAHLRGFPEGAGAFEGVSWVRRLRGDDREIVKGWKTPIDFLFIDTSHEYHHTREELAKWGYWVRVGGKIAMHDTWHTLGHAVNCGRALDDFLRENPGLYAVEHHQFQGGLSVLTKLKS